MKKLLLSATLLVAFSLTSFAGEKAANIPKEANIEVVEAGVTSDCTTIHIRWNDATSDGEGGMILAYHRVDIEICDNGIVTITGS